jgi:hypothetical protein
MPSLINSVEICAPYSVYPLTQVHGGFMIGEITSFMGSGTWKTFNGTTFPSKQDALDHIIKNADGHPFLIMTQHVSGWYEVDQYE